MSIGSAVYKDFASMQEAIQPLVAKDVLLVAAYHNSNFPSYPAFCPGVFGVRQNRTGTLPNRNYTFDTTGVIPRIENSLIAHFSGPLADYAGKTFQVSQSNSFAAPVVTAALCRLLSQNKCASFSDALAFLQEHAKKQVCREPFLEAEYPLGPVQIPVIAIRGEEAFSEIKKYFQEDGYYAEAISTSKEAGTIPKKLYCRGDGSMSPNAFSVIQDIYKCDLILYDLDRKEDCPDGVDLLLDGNILYKGQSKAFCETPNIAYLEMLTCFS